MDSVDCAAVTPSKSRWGGILGKVFPRIRKPKVKNDGDLVKRSEGDNGDEKMAVEAFVAKVFASLSAVKAAYAELQFAHSPYDPELIHAADQMVVSELKLLSELKQCFSKKQIGWDRGDPGITLLLAEIKEKKCVVKTYESMVKKMDSQVKLKGSEIMFLKEKLEEADKENKLLEKRLNSTSELSVPDNLRLSTLNCSHFVKFFRQTVSSIRSFVRQMCWEMESAGWDLDAAASSIQPDSVKAKNRRCFAFESFVCREMFDGFNRPNFSISGEALKDSEKRQRLLMDRFTELNAAKAAAEYLARKPKSTFARFCGKKYRRLVHPGMEESLFGDCGHRRMVKSGEFPETRFFSCFAEMAKRVWLLHCLAFSFNPEASIFQVSKGAPFSDVFMDNANDEPLLSWDGSPETQPRVAFTVVPGFRLGTTVIQCLVFLC
nr:IRK-interacting protein-like [Ipomoea batatas]